MQCFLRTFTFETRSFKRNCAYKALHDFFLKNMRRICRAKTPCIFFLAKTNITFDFV